MIPGFYCENCGARAPRLHGIGHPARGMMFLCHDCYKPWVKGDTEALAKRQPVIQAVLGI